MVPRPYLVIRVLEQHVQHQLQAEGRSRDDLVEPCNTAGEYFWRYVILPEDGTAPPKHFQHSKLFWLSFFFAFRGGGSVTWIFIFVPSRSNRHNVDDGIAVFPGMNCPR